MNWSFWIRTRHYDANICDSVEPLLALYADRMASPDETRRVEAHLPGCESCRQSLSWMQATRRALTARPLALPPPDLQARIARAIAASPSVPVRPARIFALRSAYAAAASLTALGIIFSGHALLTASRHAAPPKAKLSQVASLPPSITGPYIQAALPVTPPVTIKRLPFVHRKPLSPPAERLTVLPSAGPEEAPPTPVRHSNVESLAIVVRLKAVLVPSPARRRVTAPLMAFKSPTPRVLEHEKPILPLPEKSPAPVIASTNVPPAVSIGVPTVTPQEAPHPVEVAASPSESHFQTASLLSSVQDYALKHQSRLERNLSLAGSTAIRGAIHPTTLTGLEGTEAKINAIYTP